MTSAVKNKGTLNYILYVVIAAMILFIAVKYCRYQRVYVIENINFQGNHELDEKSLTDLCGIKLGEKIFDCDLDNARTRLVSHPYIRNAYISRQFPNQINISVTERKAIASLVLNKAYAIDKYAVLLPEPKQSSIYGPRIFANELNCPEQPGYRLSHPQIRNIISMLNYISFAHPDVQAYCNELIWTNDRGWIMGHDDLPSVFLGDEDLNLKTDILRSFLLTMDKNDEDIRNLRYISLRFNKKIFVREKL